MTTEHTKTETIASRIATRIDHGIHPPGSKLPSVRRIARDEGCSISTAVAAIAVLSASGRILSVERSGHFVRAQRPSGTSAFRQMSRSLEVVRSRSHGLVRRVLEMGQDPSLAPFHGAIPHPSLLPLAPLARNLHTALAGGSELLASYSPAAGSLSLRRELSRSLSVQGIEVGADDLVVTNGCMEALSLAIEASTGPDDVVAIESPSFFGLIALLENMGRRIVEIPVDPSSGIRIDLLEDALDRHPIKALVVSPDVQNPTGACMDLPSRERLVAISRQRNLTLVEDSVYSACLFGNTSFPALAGLWPEGVIHCSSASKTISPGLRIGWMAPGRLTERVVQLKSNRTLGGPVATQEALAGYLGSAGCARHLRGFRSILRTQVQQIKNVVAESFPERTRISDPHGGFFIWIQVPGLDSLELFEAALERGIGFLPGPIFSAHRGRYRDCLRLSCGTPLSQKWASKLRELGSLAGLNRGAPSSTVGDPTDT